MRRHLGACSSIRPIALASFLFLVACTSQPANDAGQSTPTSPRDPTASPSVEATKEPSPTVTTSPAALEDGRHFGFITSIEANTGRMVFDLAEFLTGDEANRAAIEDGVLEPGQSIDNDYYIRNRNPKLRDLLVAPDVQIILVNWPNCCETTVNGLLEDFAASFAAPTDDYHGATSPYWLTIDGGFVTKIEEQYLP